MAVSGDFRVSAAVNPFKVVSSLRHFSPPKVEYNVFAGALYRSGARGHSIRCHSKHLSEEYNLSNNLSIESFLLNTVNMSFLDRLNLAWKIIFPPRASCRNSNANIAKQRLKMILFSDRCAVSDEAKRKIVSNVVNALSEFVEIESQEKVQLSVSTDPDFGTMYSVTVPVRRVRSEYQVDDETGMIANVEYKDSGVASGCVDVKFDFYVPTPSGEQIPRMSDEEHHFESKADAGASKTFPQQAGTIRKNGYIVIKGRPCKVVEVSTSKTGKHGHAKCHFVAIDIFTAKKLEDIVPSSHNCD
ncbi:hypothetical protein M569_07874, partial [Genlisea aurea]